MTISEKIRELQGQLTPDTTAEERERLLLDIMTYQYIIDRSALKENSDLTAVSDLMKRSYSYDFKQYGILSEMSKNMTNEEAMQAAADPTALYKKVADDVKKFYDDTLNANEEKFKKTHDVVLAPNEYVEKVINNGWVMGDEDRRLVRAVYRVGRYGGSDKYIELYDKMLNTDVKTVEARKKMLEEIKAAEPELKGMIFNGMSKSDVVISNIKKFKAEPTQQELDQKIKENEERVKEAEEARKARQERERKAAEKEAEKNKLIKQLKANGWKQPGAAENLYNMFKYAENVKDQSKLDAALEIIRNTKLPAGKEYTMQNVLIRDAINLVMEQTDNKPGKLFAGAAAKRLENNFINYGAQNEEFNERKRTELPAFKNKLLENGWNKKTVDANADAMFLLCNYETSADMSRQKAMYDKLCNTKIKRDRPSREMKSFLQEVADIAASENKNELSSIDSGIRKIQKAVKNITEETIEAEDKAYFAFDKNVKAKKSSHEAGDNVNRAGVTYEDMQKKAALKAEKKAFAAEQEQLRAQRDARNQALQGDQINIDEQPEQIQKAQHTNVINKLSPLVDSLSLKKGFFTTKNRSLSHLKDLTKELLVNCDPNKEDGFTNEERVEKLIALRDEAERLSVKKPEAKAVLGAVNELLSDPVNLKVLTQMEEKADMAAGLHENAEEKEAAKHKANGIGDDWEVIEDERITDLRKDIQDITWGNETALAQADMTFNDTKKGFEEKKAAAAAAVSEIIAGKLYEKALSDMPKGAKKPDKGEIMGYIWNKAADIREREDFKLMMADVIDKQDLQRLQSKAVNGNALIDELSRYTKIVQQEQATKAKNAVNPEMQNVQQGPAMQ